MAESMEGLAWVPKFRSCTDREAADFRRTLLYLCILPRAVTSVDEHANG